MPPSAMPHAIGSSRTPGTVLVTGGAGFIGRSLTSQLLEREHAVVVLDDGSTGVLGDVPSGASVVSGDVREPGVVAQAMRGVDCVFHLAAAVGPRLVAEDPVDTWSRNVEGTAEVVRQAAARGARFLFVSSSEVYDAGQLAMRGAMTESESVTLDPRGRRELYAISKIAGESLIWAQHRAAHFAATIVRPFNVVGPGQQGRYGMVMARFADAIRGGRALEVYGDGSQRRCFLHVDDAVAALIKLAETRQSIGKTVNVGSDNEVSIGELARRFVRVAHASNEICFRPFAEVYGEAFRDPRRRLPDLAQLRSLIHWTPNRSLDDVILDVLRAAPTLT